MPTKPSSPKTKLGPPPLQTAKFRVLAAQRPTNDVRKSDVEQRILDPVQQKCLQHAKHANTPESEAQAAFRMASRLMAQYNVAQADLLDQSSSDGDYVALAGESVVAITRTSDGSDSRVRAQAWADRIIQAMTILFDYKAYSTRRSKSIDWTFYGIAENTATAAIAFETAHNLALDWAWSKKGISSRHSYCMGIGGGLIRIGKEEKTREEEQTKGQEKHGEQLQHEARNLCGPKNGELDEKVSPLYSERNNGAAQEFLTSGISDAHADMTEKQSAKIDENQDYYDDITDGDGSEGEDEPEAGVTFNESDEKPLDLDTDLDQQLHEMLPDRLPSTFPGAAALDTETQLTTSPWNTTQALVKLRQFAEKVAVEYLKSQDIKLRKGRKDKYSIKNLDAYREGEKDSRNMDLKRKRIEDSST